MSGKTLEPQPFQAADVHGALKHACEELSHLVAGNFKVILEMEVPARIRINGEDHLTHAIEHKVFAPEP